MDIELIEIRDFLAAHHPFSDLPQEVLDRLPKELSVRYLRRGTPFPPEDADGSYLYIVRQGAIEMRDHKGDLLAKLCEGDLCPSPCTPNAPEASFDGMTAEDTLLYLLPCERLQTLRRQHVEFDSHFAASIADRLKKALDILQEAPASGSGLMTVEVGDLVTKEPIRVPPDTTIVDAAKLMTQNRVSSVLITEGEGLIGLITDRDLRSRCIAAGLPTDRPVREIMTTKVQTIPRDMVGFQALMTMTRLNIHHLPVTDGPRLLGMVSTTDLIRHESANAVYLVGDVHKAPSIDALREISRKLPELQVQLVVSGATAKQVGEAVSTVTDALTYRLLELAEQQLGAPPVPYAWVTCGSHARREQTSHSDQDNALIISDGMTPEDDKYFEALANFVNDGLNACGFVYCPGDVMAKNPKWRQPLFQWRRYFDTWINRPEPMALMLSCVFFDMRVVRGMAELLEDLQEESLRTSKGNGIFLAYMVGNALKHRPPLGFFRNLVLISGGEHDNTLDIKHRGVVPVVDLARVYALSEGVPEINTIDRLRAVAASNIVSGEGADNLIDAFEFIGTLRVQHQVRQLRAGKKANNFLSPEDLSALERSHLKDAFGVIATMQTTLEKRYPHGRFF
jgi:CBS domain-containing protein